MAFKATNIDDLIKVIYTDGKDFQVMCPRLLKEAWEVDANVEGQGKKESYEEGVIRSLKCCCLAK